MDYKNIVVGFDVDVVEKIVDKTRSNGCAKNVIKLERVFY